MKKIFYIINLLSTIMILLISINTINYKKNTKKLENQIKLIFKESLFFSLEKKDEFYINNEIFENKFKEVVIIVIKNNNIEKYSIDIGYVINKQKCKGVNLCLKYKIKVVPQKMIISYVIKE